MSNPWFRLYSEIIDDEKLLMLAFQDRWHYVAILCLKNKGVLDAGSDNSKLNRKVAVKLGLSLSESDELKRRLIEEGLIDDVWQPLGWDERQFQSDSSKERVRKYRERQREKRYCNVTVTAQESEEEEYTELESARRVPDDWEPPPDTLLFSWNVPRDTNIQHEASLFRLHEFKKTVTDFDRAFAKWCIRSHGFGGNKKSEPTLRARNAL